MSLIYKHTIKLTGKSYIGKTTQSMSLRLQTHISLSEQGSETHFHRALRKYGFNDIISTILENNITKENINEREKFWITKYKTFTDGYNMTKGGEGGNTREMMSDNEFKSYCNKISETMKGRVFSEAWKQKISKAKLEKPTIMVGSSNGRAVKLIIFNNMNEIVFKTHGNFKDLCNQYNLPYNSLNYSRYNDSKVKKGEFQGWYCRTDTNQ